MTQSNVGERWRNKFREMFCREDGLMNKYYYDENGDIITSTEAMEDYIEKILSAQLEEVEAKLPKEREIIDPKDLIDSSREKNQVEAHRRTWKNGRASGYNEAVSDIKSLLQSKRRS